MKEVSKTYFRSDNYHLPSPIGKVDKYALIKLDKTVGLFF